MSRCVLALSVCLLALPPVAQAQSTNGLYLSVGAGVNKMQQEDVDAKLTTGSSTTDAPGEVFTEIGPTVSVAIGRGFQSGWRVEVEGNYLSNHITGESGLSGEGLGTGTEKKYGVMANVLHEFAGARIAPYVGGGIGVLAVHEPGTVTSSGGVVVSVNGGTKGSFAYQLMGGAAFRMSGTASIVADYRFMSLVGTRTYTGVATVPGFGAFDLVNTSGHDKNHSVVFGVRFGLGG